MPGAADVPPGMPDQGVLRLPDVIALVLEHNPELATYPFDIRAAEARQLQARQRPNPELSLEIEDIRLSGAASQHRVSTVTGLGRGAIGSSFITEWSKDSETSSGGLFSEAEVTVSLSQVIELGGKRAKRMAAAARERDSASWDYEIARANVLETTAKTFIECVAAQERVTLDQELVTLAEQVLRTVSARVEAGRVSPLEVKKAETALASARLQAGNSARDLVAARTALAALWGEPAARFDRLEGWLEPVKDIPPLESLQERMKKNPDLARWGAESEKRNAVVALERAKAIPDVSVSAGYRARHNAGAKGSEWALGSEGIRRSRYSLESEDRWDSLLVLGVAIPLPIFNRNQGGIKEAEHLAAKATAERHAVHARTIAALAQTYQDLSNAQAAIQTLKSSVLPSALETFNALNEAYTQGKFGFLDVLDAQRTLFDARERHLSALSAYHQNVAMVERLLGETLWPDDAQPSE